MIQWATLVDRWAQQSARLGGWLLVGIALLAAIDPLARMLCSHPIPSIYEITELLLAVVIFAALPYTAVRDGHIAIDAIIRRCPIRLQRSMMCASSLLGAALFGAITWGLGAAAYTALHTGRTTITARLPIAPFLAVAAIASAGSTLVYCLQVLGLLTCNDSEGTRGNRPVRGEPAEPQVII